MVIAGVLCVLSQAAALAQQAPPQSATEVVSEFVEHVGSQPRHPQSIKDFVRRQWEQRQGGSDLQTFIPEALAVLYPRFKEGLDAYEAKEYAYCAKIMGGLSLTPDPYLASHAALFQVKAQVQEIQLEYAAMLLNFYFREDFDVRAHCLSADEMKFLQGYCLYHTYQDDAASTALQEFQESFAAAPPALRAAARAMQQDLQQPRARNLDTVAHLMADAGLWLTEGDAGLEVQSRQRKALMILEELIRSAEQQQQQQQQQQQSQQNQGQGQQSAQSTQRPASPAQESMLRGGQAGEGQLHGAPRAAPGEMWGRMRPHERAEIMQVLQQNFPSRYRELVEQYYSELAKEQ